MSTTRTVALALIVLHPELPACANAPDEAAGLQTATLGGGCYWCVEAVFQSVKGVSNVRPGFMGGYIKDPTYAQVLTKRTGHVEVVQFEYDPRVVEYETLLQIFWRTHDPTTRNRQGPAISSRNCRGILPTS
ncbi:MAG: peptide-methionine (S)-S-oxide reductase MsrA [Planctomycetota bacterium]